jgi:hypothetical protein
MSRDLHLSPLWIGLIMAASSGGGVAAAIILPLLQRQLAPTSLLVAGQCALAVAIAIIPISGVIRLGLAIAVMALSGIIYGASRVTLFVNLLTLRQRATPDHLLGRVGAGMRLLSVGAIFIGAVLGGFAGQTIDRGPTFLVCALGLALSVGVTRSTIASVAKLGMATSASPAG